MTVFQKFIGVFLVSAVALPGLANMPPPSLHRENAVHHPRNLTPLSDKHIVFDTCTLERSDGASCMDEAGCNCGCLCVGSRTYKNPELAIVCRVSGVETARIPVLLPVIQHIGLEAQGCGFVVGGTKISRSIQGLHGKSMADVFTPYTGPYTGFLGAVSPGIVNVQGGKFENEVGVGLNIASLEYGVQLPGIRAGRGTVQLYLKRVGNFNLPGNFVENLKEASMKDQATDERRIALDSAIKQAGNNEEIVARLSQQLKELQQQGSFTFALLKSYVFQSSREPALPVQPNEQEAGGAQVAPNRPQVEEVAQSSSVAVVTPEALPVPQSVPTVNSDERGEWVRAVPRRRAQSAPVRGNPIVKLHQYYGD